MAKEKMFGLVPRFDEAELNRRVGVVKAMSLTVALNHPRRDAIVNTFVEVYREMESDDRLDGGCHLLAAHSHILLCEQGIENELCVGEYFVPASAESEAFSGSHSWVEIRPGPGKDEILKLLGDPETRDQTMRQLFEGDDDARIIFDVSIARPLIPAPRELSPVLGSTEVYSGDQTPIIHGFPRDLDAEAIGRVQQTVGEFAAGLRTVAGVDFWFWAQRTSGRMGLRVKTSKLAAKYGRRRWVHRVRGSLLQEMLESLRNGKEDD